MAVLDQDTYEEPTGREDLFSRFLSQWPIITVACISVLILSLYSLQHKEQRSEGRKAVFISEASSYSNEIDFRVHDYLSLMESIRAFFYASQDVTEEEWNTYLEGIDVRSHFPGIHLLGFAEALKAGSDSSARLQHIFLSDGKYLPIDGAALDSSEDRKQALRESMERGVFVVQTESTNKLTDPESSLVEMFLPVYSNKSLIPDLNDRGKLILGWIFSIVEIEDLLVKGRDHIDSSWEGLEVDFREAKEGSDGSIGQGIDFPLVYRRKLSLGERQWLLRVSAKSGHPELEDIHGDSNLTFGIIISFLILGIVSLLMRTKQHAESIARALVKSVRSSEERYKRIVEDQSELLCRFDSDLKMTFVNSAFSSVFGGSSESFVGKSFLELVDESCHEKVYAALKADDLAMGINVSEQYLVKTLEGSNSYQQWTHRGIFDDQGELIEYQSFGWDTTAQVELERELDDIFELMTETSRMAKVGGWKLTKDGALTWTDEVYNIHERPLNNEPELEKTVEYYAPEARELITRAVKDGFETGKTWDLELPLVTETGKSIWVRTIGRPIFDEKNEQVVCLVGAFQDITERHEQQAKSSEFERRSELALQGADLGTWDWYIQTGETSFNDRWTEMLGYSPGEVESNVSSWSKLVHPDDAEYVTKTLNEHLEGKSEIYETEHRMLAKDGSWKWILDRGKVIEWDSDGKPLRASGTHLDITDRKIYEQELQQSKLLYETLTSTVPVGIFRTNPKGECLFVNNRWTEYAGLSHQEALGHGWLEAIHPSDRDRVMAEWSESAELGRQFKSEYRFQRADGEVFWLFGLASPETDKNGDIIGYVGTITDITQRHKIEEALVAAKQAAEEASKAKSQFLANMSHEIRTPMNGVLGMTELLMQTKLNDEQQDLAKTAYISAESLLSIINDILDFSKIEAGKLELASEVFTLKDFLNEVESSHKLSVGKKDISFILTIDSEVPSQVIGDPNRLRQVLINLIGNSTKFTPAGGAIILQVAEESKSDDSVVLQFSVSDTGKGISSQKQKEIFEAFAQEDSGVTREYGGTGLGLAISSQLVRLMNGDIGVVSERGKGSVFYFTAEFEIPDEDYKPKDVSQESMNWDMKESLKILLAEDNAINRKLAITILENAGHKVLVAENGQQALDLIEAETVDLVLMDIQMPIMSGEEAVGILRRREAEGDRHTPVVALTAHAMSGDRERYLNMGMDGYVAKPIRRAELFDEIRMVMGNANAENLSDSDRLEV